MSSRLPYSLACAVLVGLAVASAGCSTAAPRSLAPRLPTPELVGQLADAPAGALLAWPCRNDSGADLLFATDLALLRMHRSDRDLVAARIVASLLRDLDQTIADELLLVGREVVLRDPEAGLELSPALDAAGATALLSARVTHWERIDPPRADGTVVIFSLEVAVIAPGVADPIVQWRIDRYPLVELQEFTPRQQAVRVARDAGRALAGRPARRHQED